MGGVDIYMIPNSKLGEESIHQTIDSVEKGTSVMEHNSAMYNLQDTKIPKNSYVDTSVLYS